MVETTENTNINDISAKKIYDSVECPKHYTDSKIEVIDYSY